MPTKTSKIPTYEQALSWVEVEYKKSMTTGKVSKELLVCQAFLLKIHALQSQLLPESDSSTILEHKAKKR